MKAIRRGGCLIAGVLLAGMLAACQSPDYAAQTHQVLPTGGDDWDAPVALAPAMSSPASRAAASRPPPAGSRLDSASRAVPPAPVAPVFADHRRHFRLSDEGQPVATVGPPEKTVMAPVELPAARVTHVNRKDGYVILACERMPAAGEDAQLFRGDEMVGMIRFVSTRRGRYIVGDIVSGSPERGDIARYKLLFPQKEPAARRTPRSASGGDSDRQEGARIFPDFF